MIRWFAGHPTAANLLLILLLAVGLFAVPGLKRETFPDYLPGEVGVEVKYRGATAADVEDEICRRLHDALNGVDFLDELVCVAQDNLASATATMEDDGDIGRFLDDVSTEVEAITDFPEQADPPVVRELHRSDLVAALAVGGDMPLSDLEDYAKTLEDRLLRLPGVAKVDIQGLSQRQWQIEVPQEALGQYGLSASELAAILSRQNIDMPLGILETPHQDIQLRFTDQRHTLRELQDVVVVSGAEGGELTLGQIATLRETPEREEEKTWFDGQRALVLEVHKTLRDDALDVMNALQSMVEKERQRLDGNVSLTLTQDMTSIVRDRLQMLVENGIQGFVLVVLVMSLFFRPRLALWAVLGLPVAFLGAFAVMGFAGLSLNMITLVALLMAIGIVMDDAIVITDNIAEHALKGASPLEAVVEGALGVLPGVVSSFLTTVAVFLPLSFLVGEMGDVLKVLPVVLIAALSASLIEAFFILPHHLKGSLHRLQAEPSRLRVGFDRRFEAFREGVGRLADAAIRWRYALLGGVLILLLGSGGYLAGGHIGSEAMPEIDGDVLEARILMPQGTPLSRTEAVASRVEEALREIDARLTPEQPDETPLVRAIQVRFNHNHSAREAGAHVATLIVDLLSTERRSLSLNELTTAWQKETGDIPGLLSLIIQEPGFGPAGIPIEVRLQGESLEGLKAASLELSEHLAGYTGVYSVIDDLRPGKPERRLSLAQGAHGLGLTAEETAAQLRAAMLGQISDTLRIGQRDVEILVRHAEQDRQSLDDLQDLTVQLPGGGRVPLEVVADIEKARGWARITRVDGQRTATVTADVDATVANAQAIVDDIRQSWLPDFQARHPEVTVAFEGQVARSAETGGSIRRALLIGLIGIFVILSFQFRSYVEPLIVMLSIPLAFVGALWGHVLMGFYFSMPSMIGVASLAGIVVNNAILLIHFIKSYRVSGQSAIAAAGQASRDRLRAILISTSTTIAGLLPLLAETSAQAAAVQPLVIAVVFGLLTSTILVLVVIPALYVIFDDLGWARVEEGTSGKVMPRASKPT
nr:efflux RND transporter permease subunit [uncultured Halomonas sp.]